jgi:hypothetical protein
MTHYKSLVDSDWLGQWDIPTGRKVVVEIESVARYVPARAQKKKVDGAWVEEPTKRIVVSFVGKRKKWLAGPVSQKAIASLYGPHVEAWRGKRLTLYVDAGVEFGGKTVGGIRIEPTVPRGGVTADALDNPVDEERAAMIEEEKSGVRS